MPTKLRTLLLCIAASTSVALQASTRAPVGSAPVLARSRRPRSSPLRLTQEDELLRTEIEDSEEDSADSGPKILMPPVESLGLMPAEATSFAGYLAPYAVLVLGAFALACGAFALLVLQG